MSETKETREAERPTSDSESIDSRSVASTGPCARGWPEEGLRQAEGQEISRAVTLAAEINAIKETVKQTAVHAAIEIGKRLKEAKSLVPYGSWGKWLEERVDYSERTAQNLMALAEEYKYKEPQAIAGLPLTKAVLLLGVPGEEREQFLAEHPVEEMSTRALKEEIARLNAEKEKQQLTIEELMAKAEEGKPDEEVAAKVQQDAAKTQQKITEAERKAAEAEQRAESAHQRAKQEQAEAEKARQEAAEAKKQMAAEAEKAREARDKAKASEAEAARLREELKAAGQPVIQQVPPQDMVEELNRLRATAASEGGVAKFRAAFEIFRKSLEQMEDALNGMEGETRAQYAGAARKAMEIAAGKLEG